ncbi:MAG: hypothetical protein KAR51_03815, partial [Candidatus Aenigmarchaeota archaeon]|nr:hypothetical protein [Candidatus Aenigmarchaeota archaeon]
MESKPQLSNPQIKSESAASWGATTTGGWGEKFYFNISVNDPQGDEVNLTLWWNESFGTDREHTYLNETICTSCTPESNQTIDYQGFFCNTTISDIDTDVYFRINASDNSTGDYNNSWGPDSGYSFEIEEDDVNAFNITPGWNATVNRSSWSNFTILLVDADRNAAPTAAELKSSDSPIYISKYRDNDSLDVAYITINGTGYLNREMVNDTDHWCKSYFLLGQNYWKGGVLSGADCFKGNLTEPGPSSALPFMLYGDLYPTITAPVGLINYSITETIPFQGTIADDCGAAIIDENAEVYFKMMQGGSEIANCNASYAGGFWSCSISTNFVDFSKGYYNVTMNASWEYYNPGESTFEEAFYLFAVPLLENPSVTPSIPEGWGVERNFSINVTDDSADTVTVYLWEKAASGEWKQIGTPNNCNPCDGTILSWAYNYTCSNFSVESARNFKFNATDLD